MLELYLRWERGQLQWHDPETGRAIMNLAEMQRVAEAEQAGQEAAGVAAERIRELEERLHRLES